MTMSVQDDCKHVGSEGKTYCGSCGKQLVDPDEARLEGMLDGIVTKILTKHGVIKEPKAKGGSLSDRLMGGKK
jgi:hypothetical protein